jgi:DNA-binding PadR family transcriptional regulator
MSRRTATDREGNDVPPHSATPDLGRQADIALVIMVSLSAGPKHGYAIMEDGETIAGHRIGPGTLYAALARLERLGLIEPLPDDGTRRRPYRLTGAGTATLRAQLDSLRTLAETGLGRLD